MARVFEVAWKYPWHYPAPSVSGEAVIDTAVENPIIAATESYSSMGWSRLYYGSLWVVSVCWDKGRDPAAATNKEMV